MESSVFIKDKLCPSTVFAKVHKVCLFGFTQLVWHSLGLNSRPLEWLLYMQIIDQWERNPGKGDEETRENEVQARHHYTRPLYRTCTLSKWTQQQWWVSAVTTEGRPGAKQGIRISKWIKRNSDKRGSGYWKYMWLNAIEDTY